MAKKKNDNPNPNEGTPEFDENDIFYYEEEPPADEDIVEIVDDDAVELIDEPEAVPAAADDEMDEIVELIDEPAPAPAAEEEEADVIDLEEVQLVEESPAAAREPEEVELVEEERELLEDTPASPIPPAVPRTAPKTRITGRSVSHTMLARDEEPLDMPGSELRETASPAAESQPPAAEQPPESLKATETPAEMPVKPTMPLRPKTRIAGRSPSPTMLARDEEPLDMPGSELRPPEEKCPPPAAEQPSEPAAEEPVTPAVPRAPKTRIAGRSVSHTMLAGSDEPLEIGETPADEATPEAVSGPSPAAEAPTQAGAETPPAQEDFAFPNLSLEESGAAAIPDEELVSYEPTAAADAGSDLLSLEELDEAVLPEEEAGPESGDMLVLEDSPSAVDLAGEVEASLMDEVEVLDAEELLAEDAAEADVEDEDEIVVSEADLIDEEALPAGLDESDISIEDLLGDELLSDEPAAASTAAGEINEDDLFAEEMLVEGASEVNLGDRPGEQPSGVDLIAEALESHVDLGKEDAKAAEDIIDEVIDFDVAESVESSAVDLGSSSVESIDLDDIEMEEMAAADAPEDLDLEPIGKGDVDATVAFDLENAQTSAAGPVLDADEDEVVIEENLLEDEEQPISSFDLSEEADLGEVVEEVEEVEEVDGAEAIVDEDFLVDGEDLVLEEEEDAEALATSALLDEEDDLFAAAAEESAAADVDEGLSVSSLSDEDDEDRPAEISLEDEEEGDEGIAVDLGDEDEPKPAKKKDKKKKKGKDEESEDKKPARAKKPKYGRRWLAGTAVGILMLGAAVAGVWYTVPDQITKLVAMSPNYQPPPPPPPPPQPTPVEQAAPLLAKGAYAEALALLPTDAAATAEEKALRGEATWLKYLQEQQATKAPLKTDDPAVKQALKDVEEAKQPLLKEQILSTIAKQNLTGQVNELQQLQQTVAAMLAKADVLKDDKAAPQEVTDAVKQALAERATEKAKVADITRSLVTNKLVDDPQAFDPKMFDQLAKDLATAKQTLQEVVKTLSTKPDTVTKDVKDLLATRDDLETKVAEINAKLKDAKVNDPGVKGVTELVNARNELQTKLGELNQAALTALKQLNEGKEPPADVNITKDLVDLAAEVSERAKSPLMTALGQMMSSLNTFNGMATRWVANRLENTALQAQLKIYQLREPLIDAPEKKLDTWISLFHNRGSNNSRDISKANKDAQWVLSPDAKAGPDLKAKAEYLEGLLLRNQQEYADARQHLQAALKQAAGLKPQPEWLTAAETALKELSEPSAYYLPLALNLRKTGRLEEALKELNTGLQVLPDNAQLLVLRSQVLLDRARAADSIKSDVEKQIRADAVAALKEESTKAKAHYVLGSLDESLGQLSRAEANYRQALQNAQKGDDIDLYRIALARLLLRERLAPEPAAEEPKAANQVGQMLRQRKGELVHDRAALQALLTLALTGVQFDVVDEDSPQQKARIEESLKLAKELLLSDDERTRGQGYMLMGHALSMQGKRTEGLKTYIKGMKMFYPGVEAKTLSKLIEAHPAFQLPDVLSQPNPVLAELHYGKGLQNYWDEQYKEAESQFKRAVGYNKSDARFFYFLGLSQLAQQTKAKRESAWFNFEQGGRLEVQSLPNTQEVNFSLERIQGPVRDYLDEFRRKAALASR